MGEKSPDAAESGPDSRGRLFTRSQQPYAATADYAPTRKLLVLV